MRLKRVLVTALLLFSVPAFGGELRLSLRQAIELALINNPELRSSRLDLEISQASLIQTRANYDPYFQVSSNFSHSEQPTSQPAFGTENENMSVNFSTGASTPSGGNVSIDFQNQQQKSNSSFVTLNPSWNVNLGLNFSQPILKGGLMDWRKDEIKKKMNDYAQSEISLKAKALEIASRVEDAYWSLVRANLEYEISQKSLERSESMVKLTEAQVRNGISPQVALLQSQSNREGVRASLYQGEAALRKAENNLKQLLYFETEEELLLSKIIPTDQPRVEQYQFERAKFLENAMLKNYTMEQMRLNTDSMKISSRQSRNQLFPQLDFNSGFSIAGLAGDSKPSTQLIQTGFVIPNPFPTPQPYMLEYSTLTQAESDQEGDYFDAVSRLLDGNNLSYQVGLTFKIPIGNRSAQSQARMSEYNLQKTELELARQRRMIRFNLDSLLADFESTYKAWQASKLARELADKSYQIEKRKYELGMSTQYQLLDQEQQFKEAGKNEISALIEYNKSIGRIKRAEQGYLETGGIPSVSMTGINLSGISSSSALKGLPSNLSGMLPSGVDVNMLKGLGINIP